MDGFYRFAAGSPRVRLGNPDANLNELTSMAHEASAAGAAVVVFPELCLTGYSCGDLFFREELQSAAWKSLESLAEQTADDAITVVVGLPVRIDQALYNCAAIVQGGAIHGLVPKSALPTYGEYYERRHFTPAPHREEACAPTSYCGIPFGNDLVFRAAGLSFCVEICEDLWLPVPPSSLLAAAAPDAVLNLSASTDFLGKAFQRRERAMHQSAALGCAYLLAGAGLSESTADAVYGGQTLVAQAGRLIAENPPLAIEESHLVYADIDTASARYRRLATTSMKEPPLPPAASRVVELPCASPSCTPATLPRAPFLEEFGEAHWEKSLLSLQGVSLARRLEATHTRKLVIGVSGGADSALALLGALAALERLSLPHESLIAVVMPGFGSTSATQETAQRLSRALGADTRVIDIRDACRQHFRDIGHPEDRFDIVFENVQARERTQVLMDIANQENALVVGTGDLSEIALGWSTYNADHMSMYALNCSVPKTMVYEALRILSVQTEFANSEARAALSAIAATPASPELVPGAAADDTERRIGPYELHDFFLYHYVRNGVGRARLQEMAAIAFRDSEYSQEVIDRTLDTFLRRFRTQQFKRNCIPDGPKITISLSPRADWRMPDDM